MTVAEYPEPLLEGMNPSTHTTKTYSYPASSFHKKRNACLAARHFKYIRGSRRAVAAEEQFHKSFLPGKYMIGFCSLRYEKYQFVGAISICRIVPEGGIYK